VVEEAGTSDTGTLGRATSADMLEEMCDMRTMLWIHCLDVRVVGVWGWDTSSGSLRIAGWSVR
jgi:hypothetical protein